MKKLFLSNIIFLVLINLLIKPFYVFVIEVGVQNQVGPAEYGVFFSLFNLCYLFQIINDLGLSNYNNTTVAKDSSIINKNVSNILGVKLILSLAFLLIIALVAILIDYPSEYYPLLWVIACNQILLSLIIFFRTSISASGYYKTDSLLSILDKGILIIILAYLLWFYHATDYAFNITWFVFAQMVSLSIALCVAIILLVKKTGLISLKFSFDLSILKKSLPFALIILTMSAYSRIDGVMLERLLPDGKLEAGIYAASYRILDALNIIGFLFAGLLLPMFSKLIIQKEDLYPILSIAYQLLFAIAVSIAMYCTFFADELLLALYPTFSNSYYASILILLIWGFVGIATTHIFGTLLTANETLKKMNIVFLFGLALNIGLNLFLIPEYKAQGAAATTLVTELLIACGLVYLVVKEFDFQLPTKSILSLLAYSIILLGFYFLLSSPLNLGWLLSLILGIIVSFMVSLLLNIIDIRELKAVLNTR